MGLPAILPMIGMMGAQYVMGRGQERRGKHEAEDAQIEARRLEYERSAQALGTWQKTAYPSAEVVGAKRKTGMESLAGARTGAYENLARNLATKGFGPGTGLMERGAGGIEKGYLQGRAGFQSDLTKFEHSPMFAPPTSAYPQHMPGYTPYTGSAGQDALSQAMGMMMAWSMLQGGGFGGGGGGSTPDYNIDPNANWPGLDW